MTTFLAEGLLTPKPLSPPGGAKNHCRKADAAAFPTNTSQG